MMEAANETTVNSGADDETGGGDSPGGGGDERPQQQQSQYSPPVATPGLPRKGGGGGGAGSTIASNTASPTMIKNRFSYISPQDSVKFKIEGNLNKYGIAIGDCDNDSKNELLVGTLSGHIMVFKNSASTPFADLKTNGMIACVLIGDILNVKQNFIVTLSIEGYLNVISLSNKYSPTTQLQSKMGHSQSQRHHPHRSSTSSGGLSKSSAINLPPTIADNEVYPTSIYTLKCIFSQRLQANTMCAVLVDIDNDEQNELVVALSDRCVRSYRAVKNQEDIKLVGIHKWEFGDQIGSIRLSMVPNANILVTQQGGVYAKLECYEHHITQSNNDNKNKNKNNNNNNNNNNNEEFDKDIGNEESLEIRNERTIGLKPKYQDNRIPNLRNPQISTEIVVDIVDGRHPERKNLLAIATTDGLLVLYEDDIILWQHQLEPQILALEKLDVNGDGREELILCTWEGQTYIVDLDGRVLVTRLGQPVSCFLAGHFNIDCDTNIACFVYGTFTGNIHIYYNIDCTTFNVNKANDLIFARINKDAALCDSIEMLMRKLDFNEPRVISKEVIELLLYAVPEVRSTEESGND